MNYKPFQQAEYLPECNSTNQYVKELLLRGELQESLLLQTGFQIKGKGQGDNYWEGERDKNLLFSFNLPFKNLPAEKQFYISAIVALAIVNTLKTFLPGENICVKWPNDIYVGKEKIAGILIENTLQGNMISQSVVGLGLNVNQTSFLSDAPNPTSMKLIKGTDYKVSEVLDFFKHDFMLFLSVLNKAAYDQIKAMYLSRMYRKDLLAKYRVNGEEVEGIIRGVDKYGFLQMEINAELCSFDIKEVVYL